MTKRRKFIITSVGLSLGFVAIQLLPETYRFISITILGILTMILFLWSLWEGIGRNATVLTLVLPLFFTIGVGLFWFLLPTNIFTRIPVVVLYGIGVYALCLTSNIYTVSAIRTIALARAANGVGFVLELVTFFLLFDTILSFLLPIYFSSLAVLIISFPIFLQGFWTVNIERKITHNVLQISFVSSLVMGEIASALFFWPVSIVVGSLVLTVSAYLLLGLGQAKLDERLFSQTVRDYLLVGIAVFVGMFFATSWGG